MKEVKCFYCKDKVEKEMAVHYVYETTKSKSNRYFHPECYEIHLNNKLEKLQLDEICDYVKTEIFKLDKEKMIPPYFVNRLLGLRSGQMTLKSGVKVFGETKSYPFDIIFNTIKIQKVNILNGIYNETKFKNERHKIDYIFVIIMNNVNDVYLRMKQKQESDDKLLSKDFSEQDFKNLEYVNNTDIKKNKVAKMLNHLW